MLHTGSAAHGTGHQWPTFSLHELGVHLLLMGIAAVEIEPACTGATCRDRIAGEYCWNEVCQQTTASDKEGLEGAGLNWALPAGT